MRYGIPLKISTVPLGIIAQHRFGAFSEYPTHSRWENVKKIGSGSGTRMFEPFFTYDIPSKTDLWHTVWYIVFVEKIDDH